MNDIPVPITTMPYLAHPCPDCGQPAWYHSQCVRCRPADLCDYCDNPATPDDPDHACPQCRAIIEREGV